MLMVNHRSLVVALFVAVAGLCAADTSPVANVPDWLAKPLSLSDCLDLALKQNSAILKGNSDLEAAHGVVLQTRAVAIPRLRATGTYEFNNAIETLQLPPPAPSVNFQQIGRASCRASVLM